MKKEIDIARVREFTLMREELDLEAAMKEANRCLLCKDAPCSAGCPAGTDPGKFIRQIRFDNYKGAARTIRNNNPLGTICSYICPTEKLCEKECSVKALEDPINISALQSFAAKYGKLMGLEPLDASAKTSGKIAVIGAGPAGIACAVELAKLDYEVTIFEKSADLGGVAKWNIPAYRLPEAAIAQDMKNLADLGVTIEFNSAITDENEAANLLSKGFSAVFVATGLSAPFGLEIFKGYSNVANYIDFLKAAKGQVIDLTNKRVVVLGGGSVAVDAACSAMALGAKKVYMVALEGVSELPADAEELKLAHAMAIDIKGNSQLTGVVADGQAVTSVKGCEIEWIEPGKFIPANARAVEGAEFSLKADYVIQAIGTKPGTEVAQIVKGLKTVGKGCIVVNDDFSTNVPGIFAGGDVVNGGSTAVKAVGDGKAAAIAINEFVKGRA